MATTKASTVKAGEESAAKSRSLAKKVADSAIPDRRQKTQTVTIKKGTPQEYDLVLAFPGVVAASQLREGARNIFGQIDRTALMEDAIKSVIVEPQISSLDDFWNDHAGFDEATDTVINFLADNLN